MKKSAKPLILFSLIGFIIISAFLLGYISTKIKCDAVRKEIVDLEAGIVNKKNRQNFLTARLQYYMSEDRITEIASTELGMIRRVEPRIVLEVSKEKIDMINNQLKEKYD